ncbi:MAG: glycosyltransferase family 2 protein [Blautia sp.]|nr:glycosyltransferase family 2 protein [Blautia sp.]
MSVLSVVVPAYNEEQMLLKAAAAIAGVLKENAIEYEIVFVDDGSADGTWAQIQKAAEADTLIHGVRFSRNFGKEAAIFAGLGAATGDCVAVMDCDLQHPPQTLIEMYRLWEQGFEVIEAVKKSRGKESLFHRLCAKAFYLLMSDASSVDMTRASDFKLLDRRAVSVLLEMPEQGAFFRALSFWIGFRQVSVEFDVQEREAGVSKWSTRSLIRYALVNIASYSSKPLLVSTWTGVICLLAGLALGIQTLVRYLTGNAVAGFTTVILLILIMGSLVMINLGIIGYYIARIYEEVKGRPRYIISQKF